MTTMTTKIKKMSHKPTRVLMCRPDFFGIEYEINPWMREDNPVACEEALKQWSALYDIYTKTLGWNVELIQPEPGLPDMVFTANGGLVYGKKVVLPNFRHVDRQGETAHFRRWFEEAGYELYSPKYDFEGEGDALLWRDVLFVGYPWRSDRSVHTELIKFLGVHVVSLQLTDARFYHLDTALSIIGENAVALYEPAFTKESISNVRSFVPDVLEATAEDAFAYGLNAMSDGENIVLSDRAHPLIALYRQLGFTVYPTPIGEFQKSGGGVKCLTLELRA